MGSVRSLHKEKGRRLLVVCHTDVEGFRSVMPAKAGIQGGSALASASASWIPGLALLARNDVPAVYPSSLLWWSTILCAALDDTFICA